MQCHQLVLLAVITLASRRKTCIVVRSMKCGCDSRVQFLSYVTDLMLHTLERTCILSAIQSFTHTLTETIATFIHSVPKSTDMTAMHSTEKKKKKWKGLVY